MSGVEFSGVGVGGNDHTEGPTNTTNIDSGIVDEFSGSVVWNR